MTVGMGGMGVGFGIRFALFLIILMQRNHWRRPITMHIAHCTNHFTSFEPPKSLFLTPDDSCAIQVVVFAVAVAVAARCRRAQIIINEMISHRVSEMIITSAFRMRKKKEGKTCASVSCVMQ